VSTPQGGPALGVVTIQKRAASGGPWIDWRTARLTVDGTFSLAVTMTSSNTWVFRARMPGSAGVRAGYSPTRDLTVARVQTWTVTLALSATSAAVNSAVRYSGVVMSSSGSSGTGTVTLERRPASGGLWTPWRTAPLSQTGAFSITVTMIHPNSWSLRAAATVSAAGPPVYSPVRSLTVQ
jgi:hypothetical protein